MTAARYRLRLVDELFIAWVLAFFLIASTGSCASWRQAWDYYDACQACSKRCQALLGGWQSGTRDGDLCHCYNTDSNIYKTILAGDAK